MRFTTVGEKVLHHYIESHLRARHLRFENSRSSVGVFLFVLFAVIFFIRGLAS